MRHVHITKLAIVPQPEPTQLLAPDLVLTPKLVETLRALLAQTTFSGKPMHRETDKPSSISEAQGAEDFERVKTFMAEHPNAKVREVAGDISISVSMASKWISHIKDE